MVERVVLVPVALGCLTASVVWGRSALRLERARRRMEDGSASGALELAGAAVRKELHACVLYAIAAGALILGVAVGPEALSLALVTLAVPIAGTFVQRGKFSREASLVEERASLERRAEEVLAQSNLAPQRWAARLAPGDLPVFEGFEVGRVYEAGTGLMAGDFYDLFSLGRNRVAAVIGDVSGHGIEASITAFQVKYLLRVFLRQYRDPAQALEELNGQLFGQRPSEEFISLCVTVIDQAAGTLRFASAGHPPAWLWHDGEVRPLSSTGPLLTLDAQGQYLSREIPLDVGDLLLLYTDGLAEARSGEALFGEERIAGMLRRDPGIDADVLCKSLLEAARDFASAPLSDDVAILAVRRI
ncbi:MAG: PP2C family protein-serine/threonine phosphatase [Acidimicrobiales bacterium]